jgi:ectoine hydroxylase-related dioxygenase (phytanoyl-CoA dioxygenase family)
MNLNASSVIDTHASEHDDLLPAFEEVGALGIFHLKRIWKKSRLSRAQKLDASIAKKEWLLDVMVYDELGLGLEPAISAVFQCATVAEFEQWILATNDGSIAPSLVGRLNRNISAFFDTAHNATGVPAEEAYALSEQDWAFWHEHGYLVLPDVIGRETCEAACAAVYEFLHMEANNPDTWYSADERKHQIMVQFFRHPALNKIRESPAIQHIYRQLWQQDNLWMSTDRVSFNPPERPLWQFPGPNLHWDADLKVPLGFNTQGLVYLTDTAENQGAFTCVPGFHKKIDDWLSSLPSGRDPQQQDWQQWPAKPIAAKAGSLIVWHHALPHGSSPNKASSPRIVQYVNMRPVPVDL